MNDYAYSCRRPPPFAVFLISPLTPECFLTENYLTTFPAEACACFVLEKALRESRHLYAPGVYGGWIKQGEFLRKVDICTRQVFMVVG